MPIDNTLVILVDSGGTFYGESDMAIKLSIPITENAMDRPVIHMAPSGTLERSDDGQPVMG